jgi:hypothetical protein
MWRRGNSGIEKSGKQEASKRGWRRVRRTAEITADNKDMLDVGFQIMLS